MLLSYSIRQFYKQILQRTEGLKKMGYKVSWLLNDVDYCYNKVKFNHFKVYLLIQSLETSYVQFREKQIMMFQQIQYLGGHKYVAEKGMPKLVSCLMRRLVIIMLFINYQSSQLINISNTVAGKILFRTHFKCNVSITVN